jgi:hypothetical protein
LRAPDPLHVDVGADAQGYQAGAGNPKDAAAVVAAQYGAVPNGVDCGQCSLEKQAVEN